MRFGTPYRTRRFSLYNRGLVLTVASTLEPDRKGIKDNLSNKNIFEVRIVVFMGKNLNTPFESYGTLCCEPSNIGTKVIAAGILLQFKK